MNNLVDGLDCTWLQCTTCSLQRSAVKRSKVHLSECTAQIRFNLKTECVSRHYSDVVISEEAKLTSIQKGISSAKLDPYKCTLFTFPKKKKWLIILIIDRYSIVSCHLICCVTWVEFVEHGALFYSIEFIHLDDVFCIHLNNNPFESPVMRMVVRVLYLRFHRI